MIYWRMSNKLLDNITKVISQKCIFSYIDMFRNTHTFTKLSEPMLSSQINGIQTFFQPLGLVCLTKNGRWHPWDKSMIHLLLYVKTLKCYIHQSNSYILYAVIEDGDITSNNIMLTWEHDAIKVSNLSWHNILKIWIRKL